MAIVPMSNCHGTFIDLVSKPLFGMSVPQVIGGCVVVAMVVAVVVVAMVVVVAEVVVVVVAGA